MTLAKTLCVVTAVALLGAAAPGQVQLSDAVLCKIEQSVPANVRSFLSRRAMCAHWGGEEPYDAARRREIASAVSALHCEALDADEARIRARHVGSLPVLGALDATTDQIAWPDCARLPKAPLPKG